MKKKITIVCFVLIILLVTVCISACTDAKTDGLRTINTLLRKQYDSVSFSVKTGKDGLELNALYTFVKDGDKTNIEYYADRLNNFDVNGSAVGSPNGFITRVSGSAVFDGKTVTHVDGEAVNENIILDTVEPRITFIASYFNNAKFTNSSFSADVVNPDGFMGQENFDAADMKVQVLYNASMLGSIKISYKTADGAEVSMSYLFA